MFQSGNKDYTVIHLKWYSYILHLFCNELMGKDVNVFIILINDPVMKTTTKNRKRNDRFIVFIKFVVSITIVNEERKPT